MPSVLIKGKSSGNQIKTYNYLAPFSHQSYPFKILFLSFIGFYLLMNAFGFKPLMGVIASIAFGFATYSISSIEAAHYTKVLAMALMPAIIGSMHLLYKGNYFKGGVTLAFNLALQVYYFHYQITYYTVICMFIMVVFYLIQRHQQALTLFLFQQIGRPLLHLLLHHLHHCPLLTLVIVTC